MPAMIQTNILLTPQYRKMLADIARHYSDKLGVTCNSSDAMRLLILEGAKARGIPVPKAKKGAKS